MKDSVLCKLIEGFIRESLYKGIENTKKKQQEYKLQQRARQKAIQNPEYNTTTNNQGDGASGLNSLAIAAGIAVVALIAIIIFFL